jgi:hypothetical protein
LDKFPYLLGEIPQCASQQQELWPFVTRKGKPVKNKHHCKYNSYLCWFIFPFVL